MRILVSSAIFFPTFCTKSSVKMPLDPLPKIPRQEEVLNEFNRVLQKLDNMKNVATRSGFFMDSKLMTLKLRRARLSAQLAYSQNQSLLTELELQLAETDLKYELIRRKQFVTRSRTIRQIMKLPSHATDEKVATTDTEKNTVNKSTQVERDIDEQIEQNPETRYDRAERIRNGTGKKKWEDRTEKNALCKEKENASRVIADETPRNTARVATSSKETENCNPSKKRKTDKDSQSTDKREKARDSKEKHREKRDGETKSFKDKSKTTGKIKKIASSNDMHECNDKREDRHSGNNEKHAKKKHDVKSAKIKKHTVLNKPAGEEHNNTNVTDRARARNGNSSEEYNIEKLLITEEINNICDATEEGNDNDKSTSTAVDAQSSNECDVVSNSPVFTVLLETLNSNLVQKIQKMCEMCEMPTKDICEGFEKLGNVKRERTSSISSVKTLVLQDESN